MSKETKKLNGQSSSVVAKAGMWYTICNFLFRGMAFITTPIFTRLMSKGELGDFTNFSSWVTILIVVTAFDFSQSIIRSKLEHEDDMDSYIWSILSLSTIWTLLVYGFALLFKEQFCSWLQIDPKYLHIMFLYLLVTPAYSMLITKHRAFYKYKLFVLMTGIMTVAGTLLSLALVLMMQDKLMGRVLGYYLPHILISGGIFLHLMAKGKKVKIQYWKYACIICLPLVPHVLSLHLLSSADKVILKRICGSELTAVYGVAYSAYHIATILFDSLNKAWAPWLLESLHLKKYEDIRKTSKLYIIVFVILIWGVLMVVPEVILILGGKQYAAAIPCLPPLITSCVFQFIYTMYVNVEFYKKKTIGVSIATMIATAVNILLDLLILPKFPENAHVITAYTTMLGYVLLFVLHYFIVKKMEMAHVFDIRFNILILAATMVIAGVMNILYDHTLLRWIIIVLYGSGVLFGCYRLRDKILPLFLRKKRKKA